jgi:hypothetical protein
MPTLLAPPEGEKRITCAPGAAEPSREHLPLAVLAGAQAHQDGRPWL